MSGRVVVLAPSLKPVGGIVKIFDYVEHLMSLGLRPVICTRDSYDDALPLFLDNRYPGVRPDRGVSFRSLNEFGLEEEDLVLFSWPTNFDIIVQRLPRGFDLRQVLHLVQGTRHADSSWIGGYGTRLLTRPLSRIFVATPVLRACEPYLNPHSPSTVIPEGHRWEYFEQVRDDAFATPIRVAYTTWKSHVGDRVQSLLESDDRFEFRAIRGPAGWPELRQLYQWSDVFMATPGPKEGFYLPGLEAMASSSIVLIPNAGGNMEYCRFEVNCVLVEFESAESYVDALISVSSMSLDAVNELRARARATLQRHTLEAERARLEEFMLSVRPTPMSHT